MFKNWKANNAKRANFSGEILTIPKSKWGYLRGLKLFGKSVQNGEPAPDNPIEIKNVPSSFDLTSCGRNYYSVGDISNWTGSTSSITIEGNAISAVILSGSATYKVKSTPIPLLSGHIDHTTTLTTIKRRLIRVYDTYDTNISNSITISGWVYNSYYMGLYNAANETTYFNISDIRAHHIRVGWAMASSDMVGQTETLYNFVLRQDNATYTPYLGTTTPLSLIGAHNAGEWAGKGITLGKWDYYDQDRQVVVKGGNDIVMDGVSIRLDCKNADAGDYKSFFISKPSFNLELVESNDVLCSHFPAYRWSLVALSQGNYWWNATATTGMRLHKDFMPGYDSLNSDSERIAAANAWLNNQHLAGSSIIASCPLATPLTIPVLPQPKIQTVRDEIGYIYTNAEVQPEISANAISYGG